MNNYSVCEVYIEIGLLMEVIHCSRFKQAIYKLLGEYEAQDVITAGR